MRTKHYLLAAALGCSIWGHVQAQQLSADQARQRAEQFLTHQTELRASEPLHLLFTVSDTAQLSNNPALRSRIGEAPLLYAFGRTSGGFVLTAADERTTTVLGYAQEGTIDLANLPDGLRDLMRQYAREIGQLRESSTVITNSTLSYDPTWEPIEPLVKAKWNQDAPYYNQTPVVDGQHCLTGCTATALAQIIYYFQYQNWTNESITWFADEPGEQTVTFESPIDWSLLRPHYNPGEYSEAEGNEVAKLMKYCGAALCMSYGVDASGTSTNTEAWHLAEVTGYDARLQSRYMNNYSLREWSEMLYQELQRGPLLYGSEMGGHSFVCDGYAGEGMFYFNRGWSGQGDGAFLLTAMDDNMSLGQMAYFNLCPPQEEDIDYFPYGLYNLYVSEQSGDDLNITTEIWPFSPGSIEGQAYLQVGGAKGLTTAKVPVNLQFTEQDNQPISFQLPDADRLGLNNSRCEIELWVETADTLRQLMPQNPDAVHAYLSKQGDRYNAGFGQPEFTLTLVEAPQQIYTLDEFQVELRYARENAEVTQVNECVLLMNGEECVWASDTTQIGLFDQIGNHTSTYRLPSSIPAGHYTLLFKMGYDLNTCSNGVAVEVKEGAKLVMTQLPNLPDEAPAKEPIGFTFTVKNEGSHPFDGEIAMLGMTESEITASESLSFQLNPGEEVELADTIRIDEPIEFTLLYAFGESEFLQTAEGETFVHTIQFVEATANEEVETAETQISWQGENLVITASNPIDRYAIFDMAGKSVATATVQATTTQINGSSWPAGIYVVVVKKQDGQVVTKKIRK